MDKLMNKLLDKLMGKLALACMLALLMGGNAMAETLNFDNTAAGTSPDGWTLTMTGKGQPKWTVEAESTAPSKPNVLKQSGRATFPLAIKLATLQLFGKMNRVSSSYSRSCRAPHAGPSRA